MNNSAPPTPTIDYAEVVASAPMIELKRRQRGFAFPLAIGFLVWYFAFVLLGAFVPAFMATPVFGVINIGLILGLAQFLTTFAITMIYVSFANRKLDPLSAELRTTLEGQGSK